MAAGLSGYACREGEAADSLGLDVHFAGHMRVTPAKGFSRCKAEQFAREIFAGGKIHALGLGVDGAAARRNHHGGVLHGVERHHLAGEQFQRRRMQGSGQCQGCGELMFHIHFLHRWT